MNKYDVVVKQRFQGGVLKPCKLLGFLQHSLFQNVFLPS